MTAEVFAGGVFDAANLPPTTGMKFWSLQTFGARQSVRYTGPDAQVEYLGSFTFAADGKTILSGQLDQLSLQASWGDSKTFLMTTLSLDVSAVLGALNEGNGAAVLSFASGPDWHLHTWASESDIRGAGGNDRFHVSGAHSTYDGRAGIDTAVLAEKLSPFPEPVGDMVALKIVKPGHVTIGDNTFVDIERFEFADTKVAVDIDGNAGRAYRLYQSAFDRKPDLEGLGYQMHALDSGLSLQQVAAHFLASPEFQQTYGALDDTGFVTQLYRNVLDREPEPDGLAYHLHDLQVNGFTRAMILANFSESPENQANVIGSIDDGIVYA